MKRIRFLVAVAACPLFAVVAVGNPAPMETSPWLPVPPARPQAVRTALPGDILYQDAGRSLDATARFAPLGLVTLTDPLALPNRCRIDEVASAVPRQPVSRLEPLAIDLPPPPAAGSLTLSGLLTLGAWQAARSVRGANFNSLFQGAVSPIWQVGPDARIRPIVPLYYHVSPDPLPAPGIAVPCAAKVGPFGSRDRDAAVRPRSSQRFLPAIAPRGPPILS